LGDDHRNTSTLLSVVAVHDVVFLKLRSSTALVDVCATKKDEVAFPKVTLGCANPINVRVRRPGKIHKNDVLHKNRMGK
jgi:hypothetical protein